MLVYQVCVNCKPIGITCTDKNLDSVIAAVRLTYPHAWVDVQLFID